MPPRYSQRAATCCFSTLNEAARPSSPAWRKKVRWPGRPTAPGTTWSGSANSKRLAHDRPRRVRSSPVELAASTAGPVGPYRTAEIEQGETMMRWNRSRWVPRAWASAALIGIGVGHGHDGLARVAGDEVVEGADDAGLHLGERLAVGEAEAARVALDGLPLGQLHQVLELGAGPVAEVALEQAPVDLDLEAPGGGDRLGRLAGALERRGVDRGHVLQGGDAVGGLGLALPTSARWSPGPGRAGWSRWSASGRGGRAARAWDVGEWASWASPRHPTERPESQPAHGCRAGPRALSHRLGSVAPLPPCVHRAGGTTHRRPSSRTTGRPAATSPAPRPRPVPVDRSAATTLIRSVRGRSATRSGCPAVDLRSAEILEDLADSGAAGRAAGQASPMPALGGPAGRVERVAGYRPLPARAACPTRPRRRGP